MLTELSLRTKFLAVLLMGVLSVTVATLLVVRHAVEDQIRADIVDHLRKAVLTFKAFQGEREATLSHSAALLANLPIVRAFMTTNDQVTIQDASHDIWNITGGDLMVLGTPSAQIMAIHAAAKGISYSSVEEALGRSVKLPATTQWWYLNGHLYEVFLQPIYFGKSAEDKLLGIFALGYEINQSMAAEVSRITGSQVTFLYGGSVVATTIDPSRQADFVRKAVAIAASADLKPEDLQLSDERYLSASIELNPGAVPAVRLNVLESYDEATARFSGLYRVLVGLGILSLFGLSALAFAIFRRYTHPLEKLVGGVRALGKGDFDYPLEAHGKDELAEATTSFIRMRNDLQQAQRKLLESERLATIGRMASSISHDLRHQLTSIVANSEFLAEPDLDQQQSEELYQEIRDAVGRMTELIDSLLEFSKGRDALSLSFSSIEEIMQQAIRSVHRHPSVQDVDIELCCQDPCDGWFDGRKLERAFYNLLLNACQAIPSGAGQVNVEVRKQPQGVKILLRDNGTGIPAQVRDRIFEPFVSHAKEHGTGLGLTIVQKIVEEHGGTIRLVDASPGHTTFEVMLPPGCNPEAEISDDMSSITSDNITSTH